MPSTMTTLIGTEVLKQTTARALWLLGAGAVGVTLWACGSAVLTAGRGEAPSLGTSGAALAVVSAPGRAAALALILGVLTVTTEFRHGTIAGSLLASPQRVRLLAAKATCAALLALAIGSAATATALLAGARALQPELLNPDVFARGLGLLLTYPAYAVLGVGIGAMLPGAQAVAVVMPVALVLGLEQLAVASLAPAVEPWSLTGVAAALGHAGDTAPLLPMWAGGALLAGYAGLALLGGLSRFARWDVQS